MAIPTRGPYSNFRIAIRKFGRPNIETAVSSDPASPQPHQPSPGSAGVPPAQNRAQPGANPPTWINPERRRRLSVGMADAAPADRLAAFGIARKLSGAPREGMRAGRPRSQGMPSGRPLRNLTGGLRFPPGRVSSCPSMFPNSVVSLSNDPAAREGPVGIGAGMRRQPERHAEFNGKGIGWSRPAPGPAFDATVRPGFWLWDPGAPPGSCRTGNRNPAGAPPASCRATSG